MKASIYHLESGNFSVQENVAIPTPLSDEIRVKVLATSLNPIDAKVKFWKFVFPPGTEVVTLGIDVCGQVDAIGSDVDNIEVGDFVLYHGRMKKGNGGFAEYAIHDALTTVNLGKQCPLDPVLLAATPAGAWTAYRALYDKLHLPIFDVGKQTVDDRNSICIVGGSGGVGSFAIQMAKLSGIEHIIAVCSKKNEEHVKKLGATDFIDYTTESIHDGIQRITNGEGVDWILDCVGSETMKDSIRSLKFDGAICPTDAIVEGDLNGFLMSHVFCQVGLGSAHSRGLGPRKRMQACGKIVTNLLLEGRIVAPVTRVITLDEVGPTLMEMLSGHNTGKIVLKL